MSRNIREWDKVMTRTDGRASLFKELERAERTLDSLLLRLTSLDARLESIDNDLRVNDFETSGLFVPGSATGIVCALTGDIRGDPIHDALENLKGRGLRLPVIIKGSDRNESRETCNSILKIVEAQLKLTNSKLIINLRWSTLPPAIDSTQSIVLGTRYRHGKVKEISKLTENLMELNIQVFEDGGEFGGGLLVYKLVELVKNIGNIMVLEITLSSTLAKDVSKIAEILKTITIV